MCNKTKRPRSVRLPQLYFRPKLSNCIFVDLPKQFSCFLTMTSWEQVRVTGHWIVVLISVFNAAFTQKISTGPTREIAIYTNLPDDQFRNLERFYWFNHHPFHMTVCMDNSCLFSCWLVLWSFLALTVRLEGFDRAAVCWNRFLRFCVLSMALECLSSFMCSVNRSSWAVLSLCVLRWR